MSTKPKKRKTLKRKAKIKIKQSAKIVHRNDATRVERQNIDTIPRMKAQMPRTTGPVLKVKIKRKND